MRLVIISHKELWHDITSPSGYSTVGGFPFQMQALASLFDETTVMALEQCSALPSGALPLTGHNLSVEPLPTPKWEGFKRKLDMLFWLPKNMVKMWRAVALADAVHTPVPGDVGTIGLLIALLQKKRLFIRHCGTWGQPISIMDWLLQHLLEAVAGGYNAVLATGGGDAPPSGRNNNIAWIFATSLTHAELEGIQSSPEWNDQLPLRLITVGRLSRSKNIDVIIQALPEIMGQYPAMRLDVVGNGGVRPELEVLVGNLSLHSTVTFHGNVSHEQVIQLLCSAHLFVFPSLREGFPKAVLEALACGLPVIATPVSVIPKILRNGCGLLLENPSAQELARAVLQLVSNPAQMAKMSKLAKYTAQKYTLETWAEIIGTHLTTAWRTTLREGT